MPDDDTLDPGRFGPDHDLPFDPDTDPDVDADASADRRHRHDRASHWDVVAAVAVGGAVGSVARWAVTTAMDAPVSAFPWATFLENVTGCFALGVLMVLVVEVWPPSRYLRPFLGVGVLGGWTTFSTYALDARTLVDEGRVPLATAYVAVTLLAGLAAVLLGLRITRRLVASRRPISGGRS